MNYKGVIIEESLENKDILKNVLVLKTEVEDVTEEHKTPWIENWTMHTIEIPEEKAEKTAEEISNALDSAHGGSWYADFKNDFYHFIIFRNKFFKIDRSKPEQYMQAVDFGISLGIPGYQLDFSPIINDWERKESK